MPYIADGILKKLIDADSRKHSVFSLEKGFLGWAQCVRPSIPTEYSDAMNACNSGADRINLVAPLEVLMAR